MIAIRTVALVAAALFVVACGSGGTPSPSPASLGGRTFLSTQVQGHDLVAGTQVRLSFKDGRIGISAGCNSMSGTYQIVDGRLATGNMAGTEVGCEPPLMAQDQWVGAFISGATLTLAGDTLTLRNGDVTMTLTDREVADPDRPLEGTRWVVDGIVSGDAVSSVPQGVTAAVTITNRQFHVETGCNTGGGSVQMTDTHLTVGPLALTKKACAVDAMALERAVTSVLSGEVAYTIEADVLTLTAGRAGLTLRAAS